MTAIDRTERPLVSVIIPTHDRPECAIASIRAVLAASPLIEVVVSDTSEVDAISPAFAEEPSSRLRLLRPGRPMSVVENFNFGLAAARGEFLVFIGDDDLVSPDIVLVAQWASREAVDAVSFTFPVLYYWPNFISTTRWKANGATLAVGAYSGRVRELDTQLELAKALRHMGAGVLEMPRAYAGMVSRDLVSRIVERHGALFGGVSPDIYSAALISIEARRAFRLDFPVVIPGASGGSTSGHSARGRHVGGLRDNAHIGAFKNLVWDQRVPEYYSVPTVWGFSLLKAIEDKSEWLRQADFGHLYLKCLISDPRYKALVWGCFKTRIRCVGFTPAVGEVCSALLREARRAAAVLVRRVRPPAQKRQGDTVAGIADTEQALLALTHHRASSPVNLILPMRAR
jgi:glycosyltransferase involved in cell wall biosynthesis